MKLYAQFTFSSLDILGTKTTAPADFYIQGIPPYHLTCTGLPAGAACNFTGTQNPYPDGTDLKLTVTVPAGIAAAVYPFTVVATGGPEKASIPATLNVMDFVLHPPATFPGELPIPT